MSHKAHSIWVLFVARLRDGMMGNNRSSISIKQHPFFLDERRFVVLWYIHYHNGELWATCRKRMGMGVLEGLETLS